MTIQERINQGICCFCEGDLGQTGGNNPDPVCTIPDARCCDFCNETIVLPARPGMVNVIHNIRIARAERSDPDELPPFDLDEDQAADNEAFTVGMVNEFREKFSQTDNDIRDLILLGLFQVDQQSRQNEYGNAELRKASMMDLYGSLNEAHQEQIRRYAKLLLENQ